MTYNILEIDKEKIIYRYLNGESTVKISKDYNCNSATIWFLLKRNNVFIKSSKFRGKKDKYIEQIKKLYLQDNISIYKISKLINISCNTIIFWLKQEGIDSKKFSTHAKKTTLNEELVIKSYQDGNSTEVLAKKFNVNSAKIWNILIKNNIKLRTIRKYYFNEKFFKKIDTEEKAYCLGFWYADGNNRKKKDGIRIQICDLDILQKIAKCFRYNGEIRSKGKKSEKHQECFELQLFSTKLSEDLENKGCPPKKTFILKFPSENIIPNELLRHFIRGYFDGDGSIGCFGKTKQWKIQIVGTRELLDGINNTVGFNGRFNKRHKNRNTNNWNLVCGKQSDIKVFMDFIYKDATIFLKRKKDKFLSFEEYYNNRLQRNTDISNRIKLNTEKAKELFNQGLSCIKIGKVLNINPRQVIEYLNKEGINTSKYRRNKLIPNEIKEKIVNAINDGRFVKQICKTFNVCDKTVYKIKDSINKN